MQFVTIGEEAQKRVQEVRAHAENPGNWRTPGPDQDQIPGDEEEFIVVFEPRCKAVYTVDLTDGGPFKHLSVSVWNEEDAYLQPPPFLMFIIARLFGFTLEEGNSFLGPNPDPDIEDEHIIHAIEPLEMGEAVEA
jgi:hypothetical protein